MRSESCGLSCILWNNQSRQTYGRAISLTLSAYGFPDNGTEVIEVSKGNEKAIILKGYDFTGREKQLAMTLYDGWD